MRSVHSCFRAFATLAKQLRTSEQNKDSKKMPSVSAGSLFQIIGAIDVSKDSSTLNRDAAPNSSGAGRMIEVEEENTEGQDEDYWQRKSRESNRCLKLALKCQNTGVMKVGIELETLEWQGTADEIIGKQLKICTPLEYYMEEALLLSGRNCQVLEGSSSHQLNQTFPPVNEFDYSFDDEIIADIITIE